MSFLSKFPSPVFSWLALAFALAYVPGFGWEITPFAPPVSCSGMYYCSGDQHYRGKVSSSRRHWNQTECLRDLETQVASHCPLTTLLGEVSYLDNSTTSNGTQPIVTCPAKNYYFPWASVSIGTGGWGSSNGVTRNDAEYKASRICGKYSSSCLTLSIKYGCVAYVRDEYSYRRYLDVGCTAAQAEERARGQCRGYDCRVRKIYCAHY